MSGVDYDGLSIDLTRFSCVVPRCENPDCNMIASHTQKERTKGLCSRCSGDLMVNLVRLFIKEERAHGDTMEYIERRLLEAGVPRALVAELTGVAHDPEKLVESEGLAHEEEM